MKVHSWTEISDRDLTEDAVKALFPAEQGHRFFPNRYDAGAKFSGSLSQASRVYVFEGRCTYHTDAGPALVHAGEYADLLPGPYEFEASVESAVCLMKVYRLPQFTDKAS
ncbi:hypothetical protein ACS5PN_21925 [Roseateles sp. NT4]|uniref:hypothetical protein n=1 Tax=Roseateles sp. NT4 TaxID=3453715 RepID=UPI003EEE6E33